jgi:hypothetical protein
MSCPHLWQWNTTAESLIAVPSARKGSTSKDVSLAPLVSHANLDSIRRYPALPIGSSVRDSRRSS